jgi:hypothetical protein
MCQNRKNSLQENRERRKPFALLLMIKEWKKVLDKSVKCSYNGQVAEHSGNEYANVAHLVERHLAKVEVAGSSPVVRSRKPVFRTGFFCVLGHVVIAEKALFENEKQ